MLASLPAVTIRPPRVSADALFKATRMAAVVAAPDDHSQPQPARIGAEIARVVTGGAT
jgi:hypothetical protein